MVETMVTTVNDNILLPLGRHRRLFLELFSLSAVLSAALYLFKCLALAMDDVAAPDLYLSPRDMDILGVLKSGFLQKWLRSDHLRLLPLAYLLAGIAVGSVTYIATTCAAVLARNDYEQEEEEEEEVGDQEEEEDEEEEAEEEQQNEEEAENEEEEQKHYTLLSFLGMVKSNLARPAKIICLSCVLRLALFWLLGNLGNGALARSEVIFPAALVYFLVQFIFEVAVVASVAEERADKSAVGRACRVMWGKYKELWLYLMGWGMINHAFSVVCTLVAKVGMQQHVDAGVLCLLLAAKEVFSVANKTGYYFACRKNEKKKQNKACHVD